jgi:hypothetical protein
MQADVRVRARSRKAKLCRIRPQRTGVRGSDNMAADPAWLRTRTTSTARGRQACGVRTSIWVEKPVAPLAIPECNLEAFKDSDGRGGTLENEGPLCKVVQSDGERFQGQVRWSVSLAWLCAQPSEGTQSSEGALEYTPSAQSSEGALEYTTKRGRDNWGTMRGREMWPRARARTHSRCAGHLLPVAHFQLCTFRFNYCIQKSKSTCPTRHAPRHAWGKEE